jgi:hypothetical protein
MRSMLPADQNNNAGPLHKPVWRLLFISTKPHSTPSVLAAAEQSEAAFGGEAVVKSCTAVNQVNLVCRIYDCFAAERSLALLGSCYGLVFGASVWGRSWTPR